MIYFNLKNLTDTKYSENFNGEIKEYFYYFSKKLSKSLIMPHSPKDMKYRLGHLENENSQGHPHGC